MRSMLHNISPNFALVSETWGRMNMKIEELLSPSPFKAVGYYRKKIRSNQPGGGCEIIYNENRFNVIDVGIDVPLGVEGIWRLATSKSQSRNMKQICLGSFYVSSKSKYKNDVIDHIIQTIHCMRAQYDDINFIITGDFNLLRINDIINAYGAIKQICTKPNRKNATLQIILTDLGHLYHPPTVLPPPTSGQ